MDVSRAKWRKATRSTSTGGECVELAALPEGLGVRDSKDPDGGHLTISHRALRALLADLKQS
ncbi:DUF397 domain-containing protein [Actinomadura napierensis]|uniref:DUF397 domain-containing protein n=1 Tax=Actinomadura napierensis TaxID=267854 RepID=A0ABP5L422_9ACTN